MEEIEGFASKCRELVGTGYMSPGAGGTESEDKITRADTGYRCSEGDY